MHFTLCTLYFNEEFKKLNMSVSHEFSPFTVLFTINVFEFISTIRFQITLFYAFGVLLLLFTFPAFFCID